MRSTGIPIGVGVASTKVLAKLANRYSQKTGEVCVLNRESAAARAIIDKWPCQDIWGTAGSLAARPKVLNINRAGEMARAPRTVVRSALGIVGERIAVELGGTSCLGLEEVKSSRKSILCSRSFGRAVVTIEDLREAVAFHATGAGEKLRRQDLAASTVQVFLMTNRHRPQDPQHCPQGGRELLAPTAYTPELITYVLAVLERIYRPGFRYDETCCFRAA